MWYSCQKIPIIRWWCSYIDRSIQNCPTYYAPIIKIDNAPGTVIHFSSNQNRTINGLDYGPIIYNTCPNLNWINQFLALIQYVPTRVSG